MDGGTPAPTASRLPDVPERLAALGLRLRLETEEDESFLRRLYISVRWEELAPTGWPNEQKVAFLEQQFGLQTLHYRKFYHDAAFGIVEVDGMPVGRLYLLQTAVDLRIVDVSFLPDWRGKGLGGDLIRSVFDLGRAAGTRVSINVEVFNPARRLYERLGFTPVEEKGIYILMEWRPGP
ncbi:MAG TPA: GNAT family N-acetyltransferase [Azospirillum sp.]